MDPDPLAKVKHDLRLILVLMGAGFLGLVVLALALARL